MKNIFEKYGIWIIVFLAIILRVIKLRYAFYASVDELARDLMVSYNFIFNGQIPLLGPSASLGGFYFGAFYYYLMAPFIWLSNFHAWGAVALSTFFSILQVIIIYLLLKLWFPDKYTALIGAFLSAICFWDIQNSYYISNPNIMPFFVLLFFYSLTKVVLGQRVWFYSLAMGISLGLATQFHATILLILPICYLAALYHFRKNLKLKQNLFTIGIAALSYIPYVVYEIQNGFTNTLGILKLGGNYFSIFPNPNSLYSLVLFWNNPLIFRSTWFDLSVINRTSYLMLNGIFLAVCVFLYFQLKSRKGYLRELGILPEGRYFLLVWLIVGSLVFLFFASTIQPFYFLALWPIPLIFLAWLVSWLLQNYSKGSYLLLGVFVLAQSIQLFYFFGTVEKKELDYDNYRAIFEFTMSDAEEKAFKIVDDTGYLNFFIYYSKIHGINSRTVKNNAEILYVIVKDNDGVSTKLNNYQQLDSFEFEKFRVIKFNQLKS